MANFAFMVIGYTIVEKAKFANNEPDCFTEKSIRPNLTTIPNIIWSAKVAKTRCDEFNDYVISTGYPKRGLVFEVREVDIFSLRGPVGRTI